MRFRIKPSYEKEIAKIISATGSNEKSLTKILDIGSGKGGMAKILFDDGFDVCATDLFPENFTYPEIRCEKIDVNNPLPFPDNSFDIITTCELYEHLENHMAFVRECRRILKPYGRVIISTPNILNLKSRLSFLFTGFHTGLGPITELDFNPIEFHISSEPLYQIITIFNINGFSWEKTSASNWKESCIIWLWLYPLIWFFSKQKLSNHENPKQTIANVRIRKTLLSPDLLFGRSLIVQFQKK